MQQPANELWPQFRAALLIVGVLALAGLLLGALCMQRPSAPQTTSDRWSATDEQRFEASCGTVDKLCRCELGVYEARLKPDDYFSGLAQNGRLASSAVSQAAAEAVTTCLIKPS